MVVEHENTKSFFKDSMVDIVDMKTHYFRAISLVSMPIKILSKMLANRVQSIINPLSAKTNTGFFKPGPCRPLGQYV